MNLQQSISKTISYAYFFDYQLNASQLHYWLISPKCYSREKINQLHQLSENISPLRRKRQKISQLKLKSALRAVSWLKIIPFIKLIAVTGSLSMDNAKQDDDIDLMVITSPNSLWLTRPLALTLISLFFRRRKPQDSKLKYRSSDSICINLWLDTTSLVVPPDKHNLYVAHEVLQVKPLLNRQNTYQSFILANSWTKKYLANAYGIVVSAFTPPHSSLSSFFFPTSSLFFLPLSLLNSLSFRLQYLYMKRRITRETISLSSAYFHPRDLSSRLKEHLRSNIKVK